MYVTHLKKKPKAILLSHRIRELTSTLHSFLSKLYQKPHQNLIANLSTGVKLQREFQTSQRHSRNRGLQYFFPTTRMPTYAD